MAHLSSAVFKVDVVLVLLVIAFLALCTFAFTSCVGPGDIKAAQQLDDARAARDAELKQVGVGVVAGTMTQTEADARIKAAVEKYAAEIERLKREALERHEAIDWSAITRELVITGLGLFALDRKRERSRQRVLSTSRLHRTTPEAST